MGPVGQIGPESRLGQRAALRRTAVGPGRGVELPRRAALAGSSSGRADRAVFQFSPLAMASATRMPSTAAETMPPA